jgi:2-polyprenyl-3-methyl-5-hydroxy-6-metoxy-1,4-benzoquinol methylase
MSWLAKGLRATGDQPPSELKSFARIHVRRLPSAVLRLIDAVWGPGTSVRFSAVALNRSKAAITPAEVMRRETVESLAAGADEYYRRAIADGGAAFFRRKPFHALDDSPQVLFRLGALLHGAHLTTGLHVMDYGGGTGWLSAALWEMGCHVTCVDASSTALEFAQELFEERRPWLAWPRATIRTAVTVGRTLPLSDGSVDRIICYDVLHHLSNQQEILREFSRVLRPGGVACFCEPGRHHSSARGSQDDMRSFNVLENDIVLEDVWRLGQSVGFTDIRIRPLLDLSYSVSIDRYLSLIEKGRVTFSGREALMNGTVSTSIFFLHKGAFVPDSRYVSLLAATILVVPTQLEARVGASVALTITCTNTGQARWLARVSDASLLGTVNIGIDLYEESGQLLIRDWRRVSLPRDVESEETVDLACELVFADAGRFRLRLDLVSEGVGWFRAECTPTDIPVVIF